MTQPTAPDDDQLAFLRDKLAQNKAYFSGKTSRHRRAWVWSRVVAILVSGIVTVILGLKATTGLQIDPNVTANIALVLSALVTFLAAAEATFDFRWNYVNYGLTMTRLYGIEDRLNYKAASGTLAQTDLDAAFAQMSEAMQGVNETWSERQLSDGSAEVN